MTGFPKNGNDDVTSVEDDVTPVEDDVIPVEDDVTPVVSEATDHCIGLDLVQSH